ncbi:DUF4839 domain-containing protein [Streptomyces filamentosus]|uniref:DUF4839 domain-containing protein n=1 Tax=Streptomyces filamentosus TaxID=67294 RepID=UPI003320CDA5
MRSHRSSGTRSSDTRTTLPPPSPTANPQQRTHSETISKYVGKTIAFDGSIVHMAPHGDYNTRYDFLLGPGDHGPKTEGGPAFKYEDTNTLDLKLTGRSIPETVRAGDKFRFVAEVGEFNVKQCLFFLDPVSTEVR